MEKNEHRQKFFAILEGCARGVTSGGHLDKRYVSVCVCVCVCVMMYSYYFFSCTYIWAFYVCALSLCPTCSLVLKFPDMTSKEVCPQAFAKAHHRGHTYYDKLVRELKGGSVNGDRSMFNKHSALKPSVVKDIMKRNIFNMSLSTEQFTAATLPNTIRSLATASWMQQFFRLTGSIFIMFILSLWSSLFIYLIIMCFR